MNHVPPNPFIDMLQNEEVKELFTLERTIVQTAWMLNATRQLAELAAAFAALFFYFSDTFYTDAPFYLGYLHLFVYLGQGFFLLWKSERWVAGWSDRKRSWWRQAIAVLGWPMHYSLVVFHQKVHRFDEKYPPHMMTISWLQENLFFSLARGASLWYFGWLAALLVLIVLDQVLHLI